MTVLNSATTGNEKVHTAELPAPWLQGIVKFFSDPLIDRIGTWAEHNPTCLAQAMVSPVSNMTPNQFKVSNNSWGGGGYSQALFDVIQAAGDQFGHIFVAAAGNGGS